MLKLNLGCGHRKFDGYTNVDSVGKFNPDIIHDLETFPWPFENSSASEILLIHVLEHLGAQTQTFFSIIQEIYRVAAHNCAIKIEVPHHKHIDFFTDPTHCRIISTETLNMFSKSNCREWEAAGAANTPLALIYNVDFVITSARYMIDQDTLDALSKHGIHIKCEEAFSFINIFDNLVKQVSIEMRAIKS